MNFKNFYPVFFYALLFTLSSAHFSYGQKSIPNPNFEQWNSYQSEFGGGTYWKPDGWDGSNVHASVPVIGTYNIQTVYKNNTEAYDGTYCIEVKTMPTTGSFPPAPGFITLGKFWFNISGMSGSGGIDMSGAMAFNGRPDALRGFMKAFPVSGDKATIKIELWKGNYNASSVIAYGQKQWSGNVNSWTEFVIPLTYYKNDIPDRLCITLSSCDFENQNNIKAGSRLLVDNLSFDYSLELEEIKINGSKLIGFSSDKFVYDYKLPANASKVPNIDCKVKKGETVKINYGSVNGVTEIIVTTEDGKRQLKYYINFFTASSIDNPNFGFENWYDYKSHSSDNHIELPNGWLSSVLTLPKEIVTVKKDISSPKEGNSSILLETVNNNSIPISGIVSMGNISNNKISYKGIPYNERPISLDCFYKASPSTGDKAFIEVVLWSGKYSDENIVGYGSSLISSKTDIWTELSVPISYKIAKMPDSICIVLSSSNLTEINRIRQGSKLWIDDIRLNVVNANLTSIIIDGKPLAEFDAKKSVYNYILPAGSLSVPKIEYTSEGNVSVNIIKGNVNGITEIDANIDGIIKKYFINFSTFGSMDNMNSDFENWYEAKNISGTGNVFRPQSWNSALIDNISREQGVQNGEFALGMETKTDNSGNIVPGIVSSGAVILNNNAISINKGIAFTDTPDFMEGFYKVLLAYGDKASAKVELWNGKYNQDNLIAYGVTEFTENNGKWSSFRILLEYYNSSAPDSIRITFLSSDLSAPLIGSKLWIDNVSFGKEEKVLLSSLKIDGKDIEGFSSKQKVYNLKLPYGLTKLPEITATSEKEDISIEIVYGDANGITAINLSDMNGNLKNRYFINFSEFGDLYALNFNFDKWFEIMDNNGKDKVNVPYYWDHSGTLQKSESENGGQIVCIESSSDSEKIIPAILSIGEIQPDFSIKKGIKFNLTPDFFTFLFKSEIMATDEASVDIKLWKGSYIQENIVATGHGVFDPNSSDWSELRVDMNYLKNIQADSMSLTIYASKLSSPTLGSKIYLDKISYGYNNEVFLSDLQIDGVTINGFSPDKKVHFISLPPMTSELPQITGICSDENMIIETVYGNINGINYIKIKDNDEKIKNIYYINSSVLPDVENLNLNLQQWQEFISEPNLEFSEKPKFWNIPVSNNNKTIAVEKKSENGLFSVLLETKALNFDNNFIVPGILSSSSISADDTFENLNFTSGIPFIITPDSLKFVFKSSPLKNDKGNICIEFWKGEYSSENIIGKTSYLFEEKINLWNEVIVPIEYFSDESPEFMRITISSSDLKNTEFHEIGSQIEIKDLELIYDSKLEAIYLDGIKLDGFSADIFEYSVILPFGTKELPEITFIAAKKGSNVILNKGEVNGITTLDVIAEDGKTKSIYSINFKVEKDKGILNPGFEEWVTYKSETTGATISKPAYWATSNIGYNNNDIITVKRSSNDCTEGYNAVILESKSLENGLIVPGLICSGKYKFNNVDATSNFSDGIVFMSSPDNITGNYKSFLNENDNAVIEVVLWKGDYIENNIIGKGSINISESADKWTKFDLPINYFSNEEPDSLRLIISSSDYKNPSNIKNGNKLWIDNLKYSFNSNLSSISINGNELTDFRSDKSVYNVTCEVLPVITATAAIQSSTINIKNEHVNGTATISVVAKNEETSSVYYVNIRQKADEARMNLSFEQWYSYISEYGLKSFTRPVSWSTSNLHTCINGSNINIETAVKDINGGSGTNALKLETKFSGISDNPLINGTAELRIASQLRPDILNGFIKSLPSLGDNGMIIIETWKGTYSEENIISRGLMTFEQTINDWGNFSLPINYISSEIPDSLRIFISSSDISKRGIMKQGSKLFVDGLHFGYVNNLSMITLDGKPLKDFNANKKVYDVYVKAGSQAPVIGAIAAASETKVEIGEVILNNYTEIKVIAKDNISVNKYYVNVISENDKNSMNFDFEQWGQYVSAYGFDVYDKPVAWSLSNIHTNKGADINVIPISKEHESQHGSSAIMLETKSTYMSALTLIPGIISNGKININTDVANGYNVSGGIAFSGQPDILSGYIKAFPVQGDKGTVLIELFKDSQLIGKGISLFEEIIDNWTGFNTKIEYSSLKQPDSMRITISSSDLVNKNNTKGGSRIYIDNLSLEYNSLLDAITIDGVSIENFESENFIYDFSLPIKTQSLPKIEATAQAKGTNIYIENGKVNGITTLHITAKDGITSSKYYINFSTKPWFENANFDFSQWFEYISDLNINRSKRPVSWNCLNLKNNKSVVNGITQVNNENNNPDAIELKSYLNGDNNVAPAVISTGYIKCDENNNIVFDGGMKFSNRPDLIKGRFKSTFYADDKGVLTVELWNGEYSESSLIGSGKIVFDNSNGQWSNFTGQILYSSDDIPDSIRVTISSSDLSEKTVWHDENSITLDNIMFSYSSMLSAINIDGAVIHDFNSERYIYDYILPSGTNSLPEIEAVPVSESSIVNISKGVVNGITTITVSAPEKSNTSVYYINFYTMGASDNLNLNFEQWYSYINTNGIINKPVSWNAASLKSDKSEIYTASKGNNIIDGSSAIVLETKQTGLTSTPFIIGCATLGNINLSGGDIKISKGIAFSMTPDTLKGEFKYEGVNSDNAFIKVETWTGNYNAENIITSGIFKSGSTNGWAEFSIPLSYSGNAKPDSLRISLYSSDIENSQTVRVGSKLWIDNLQFGYISQLKSISINGNILEGFSPYIYSYKYKLPEGSTEFPPIGYSKLINDESVEFIQNGINEISYFIVTAEDQKTISQYSIFITNKQDGIEDVSGDEIKIYPNPFKDYIKVECKTENALLLLYDVNGKEIIRFELNDEVNHINTSELKQGTFMYKIIEGGRDIYKGKIIKK